MGVVRLCTAVRRRRCANCAANRREFGARTLRERQMWANPAHAGRSSRANSCKTIMLHTSDDCVSLMGLTAF